MAGRINYTPPGWYLEVDIMRDAALIRMAWNDRHKQSPARLYLHAITLDMAVVSDQWIPPNGIFDREWMSMPGGFGNVAGAEGFWGSVTRYQTSWLLADEAFLQLAGYSYLGQNWPYTLPIF